MECKCKVPKTYRTSGIRLVNVTLFKGHALIIRKKVNIITANEQLNKLKMLTMTYMEVEKYVNIFHFI